MYLQTDCTDFVPKDFVVTHFYGKNVCFAWNREEFICFPYKYEKTTDVLKVYKAPGIIKDVRTFRERVFILCHPSGIHKLTENFEFAYLSKAGIELGCDFSEVLAPNNGILLLEDKKMKHSKNLFPLIQVSNVHVLTLNHDSADKSLRKALLLDNYADDVNLCLIAYDKLLFKMSQQNVQILYTCDYIIKMIKPVEKNGKTISIILQTEENFIIFLYIEENKLKHEKVHFQTKVSNLSAILLANDTNTLFLVHSDDQNTYYTRKTFGNTSLQETRIENKIYENFKFYKHHIIYLDSNKDFIQVPIDFLIMTYNDSTSNCIKLELNMLKGLENIIEGICKKSVELNTLREKLVEKEDTLKRINLYVTKQHIKYCPKECVKKCANQVFLVSNFNKVLPPNCIVVKMLKNRGKSIFSMKHVQHCDTIVEMPICLPSLSSKLYTTTDLITYKNDGKMWCLIKNYVRDPIPSKNSRINLSKENLNFINYKLVVLQNLINENNVSMEVLQKLKNEVRNEICL